MLCVCASLCVCCLNTAVFSSSHWRETSLVAALGGGFTEHYSFGQLLQIRTLFREGYQFGSRWNTLTIANSDRLWMGHIFLEGAMEINEWRESRNRIAEWRAWRTGAIHFHLQIPSRSKVMGRQESDIFKKCSLAFACVIQLSISFCCHPESHSLVCLTSKWESN